MGPTGPDKLRILPCQHRRQGKSFEAGSRPRCLDF